MAKALSRGLGHGRQGFWDGVSVGAGSDFLAGPRGFWRLAGLCFWRGRRFFGGAELRFWRGRVSISAGLDVIFGGIGRLFGGAELLFRGHFTAGRDYLKAFSERPLPERARSSM